MLAALLNAPATQESWSIWSLANYDCLNQIRSAILTQKGVTLPSYQVEPINFADISTWLDNNQQAHQDFTKVLNQQTNDLLGVDFEDRNQLEAWIWLNFIELRNACQTLSIGP